MSIQNGARLTFEVAGHDGVQKILSPGHVRVDCQCGDSFEARRKNSRMAGQAAREKFREHCNAVRPSIMDRW